MEFLPLIIAALGGGSIVGIIIKYFFDKPLTNAQIAKIVSETRASDQKQILDWMAKVEDLYKTLETERKDRDKEKRGERDSRDMEKAEIAATREQEKKVYDKKLSDLSDQVLTANLINGSLEKQVGELKQTIKELKQIADEKEKRVKELEKMTDKHSGEIAGLRRDTGNLFQRRKDNTSE